MSLVCPTLPFGEVQLQIFLVEKNWHSDHCAILWQLSKENIWKIKILYRIHVYGLPEIALLMQSLNFYLYCRYNKCLILVVCAHEFVTDNHLVTQYVYWSVHYPRWTVLCMKLLTESASLYIQANPSIHQQQFSPHKGCHSRCGYSHLTWIHLVQWFKLHG